MLICNFKIRRFLETLHLVIAWK